MDFFKDVDLKRKKYMPIFPKASGHHTTRIEGYPSEDDVPMAATGFHGEQIITLYHQLNLYFEANRLVYVGVDSFVYYREGDASKVVTPNIYVVPGVEKSPQRYSFYTWAEGAVPAVVFEFPTDETTIDERAEMIHEYLIDIGVQECFFHQPAGDRLPEFHGWRRSPSGKIKEIIPDAQGGLLSQALNLWLRWTLGHDNVRLLRIYFPDGTPIPTSQEIHEEYERLHPEYAASRAKHVAETLSRH